MHSQISTIHLWSTKLYFLIACFLQQWETVVNHKGIPSSAVINWDSVQKKRFFFFFLLPLKFPAWYLVRGISLGIYSFLQRINFLQVKGVFMRFSWSHKILSAFDIKVGKNLWSVQATETDRNIFKSHNLVPNMNLSLSFPRFLTAIHNFPISFFVVVVVLQPFQSIIHSHNKPTFVHNVPRNLN